MSKKNFLSKLTKCAAIALVFGMVGGAAFEGTSYFIGKLGDTVDEAAGGTEVETNIKQVSSTDTVTPSNTNVVSSSDISKIVEDAMPSIVAITSMTQQQMRDLFGQTQQFESESSGSGIIVKKDDTSIYIVTNNHVVQQSNTLTVQFSDDSTATATVRGTAPSNDLAVIQIALADISEETLGVIKVADIGDSEELSVGDGAIAIGNALGYGQSVTTGVISAMEREVSIQDETTGITVTNKLLQTDAAINPGNSGGALFNEKGQVIGINSSKYSDTTVEGMGFAIPMSTAGPIIEDLITNGKTTTTGSPYLGIYGVDVTEDVAQSYNMPSGVYVAKVVEGSGAQQAGIVSGNIITAVEGKAVSSMEELKKEISGYKVGDEVKFTVQIADSGSYIEKEITVTLSSQSSTEETTDGAQEMPQQEIPQPELPQGN